MKVGVFIADAQDAEDANRQCKESPAYRQICRQYPSATWNRRHLQTVRHMGMAGPELQGPGAWMVEFEVLPKGTEG